MPRVPMMRRRMAIRRRIAAAHVAARHADAEVHPAIPRAQAILAAAGARSDTPDLSEVATARPGLRVGRRGGGERGLFAPELSQQPGAAEAALQAVEQRVVDALPEIIDALIGRAKAGDMKAAIYLADRILGRTAGSKVAPADDRERPYDEAAYELDEQEREEDNDIRRMFAVSGARRGA